MKIPLTGLINLLQIGFLLGSDLQVSLFGLRGPEVRP